MEYRAVFKCIAGCPGEYDLEQPIYRCPVCGDLLEVVHDLEALRPLSADAWKKLFDDRYKRTEWPYGSAVWGKKEWVCPGVRDENIVLQACFDGLGDPMPTADRTCVDPWPEGQATGISER